MSKKFIIILISSVLGLLLVCMIGYFFIIQNGNPSAPGGLSFRSFFPFGGDQTPTPTASSTPETPAEPQQPTQVDFTKKLRELSSEPVSGAGTLDIKAGTMVRYMEKTTGHIFEVEMFSPRQDRISNTTIPLAYDAVWGNKGTSMIARYLKDNDQTVDTYSLTLKNTSTTTENTIAGIAFPPNISDVSIFGTNVLYLVKNSGASLAYISNFDGSKKKLVWNSDIRELNIQFVNDKIIALNTKPYPNVPGYLYLVDTGNGVVKTVLRNVSGLTSLVAPSGNPIIFLQQTDGAGTFLYDQSIRTSKSITPATFPEKCVWSKKDLNVVYCAVPKENLDGMSLTSWYMGKVSFSDDIWKYDLKNNTSSIIESLSVDAGTPIDVIKPILSDNEQYLIFVNKIDNSLWSLDLTK